MTIIVVLVNHDRLLEDQCNPIKGPTNSKIPLAVDIHNDDRHHAPQWGSKSNLGESPILKWIYVYPAN